MWYYELTCTKRYGSQWTCWHKANKIYYYFDIYELMPPIELENYVKCDLLINTYQGQKEITFPYKALSQYDLLKFASEMNLPKFRGVFMRNQLSMKPFKYKCSIMNLDIQKDNGTNWTCWHKANKICYYFDKCGLMLPIELKNYVKCDLLINTYQVQKENDIICDQLCLCVLYKLLIKKETYVQYVFELFALKLVS